MSCADIAGELPATVVAEPHGPDPNSSSQTRTLVTVSLQTNRVSVNANVLFFLY